MACVYCVGQCVSLLFDETRSYGGGKKEVGIQTVGVGVVGVKV